MRKGRRGQKWKGVFTQVQRSIATNVVGMAMWQRAAINECLPPLVVHPPRDPNSVVGRLAMFWQEWEAIGASCQVVNWIRGGVVMQPEEELPGEQEILENAIVKDEEISWTNTEIQRLLASGAVEHLPVRPEGAWQSKLWLAPKKGPKKFRLVVNMRPVNQFFRKQSWRMETLSTALRLVQPGDWMLTFDLKEGYFHVPVSSGSRKFLLFQWRGLWFQYTCLPFGFSHSPFIFCKTVKQMVNHWRKKGIRVMAYVDDFLVVERTKEDLLRTRKVIEEDLKRLGWIRESSKGVWEPSQKIMFLGLELDSENKEVRIPVEKVEALRSNIAFLLEQKEVSARQLAGIAGRLISVARAFAPARLYTRSFYQLIKRHRLAKWDWDSTFTLSEQELKDAQWLIVNLEKFNGRAAWLPAVLLTIQTDASLTGWGAVLQAAQARGMWSSAEKGLHINRLEIKAVEQAIHSFKGFLYGQAFQVASDSSVAVSYLENGGGSNKDMSDQVRTIWELLIQCGATLIRSFWIPGKENEADSLSRYKDFEDWRLTQRVFEQLQRKWGPHTVDRMADHLNTHLEVFNSLMWCPRTAAVNAFAQHWGGQNNYVCPPARLVHQVLLHIRECRAKATVIVPNWGGQPWWPLLQELKVDELLLPPPREAFCQGESGRVEPWRNASWMYLAVRIEPRG